MLASFPLLWRKGKGLGHAGRTFLDFEKALPDLLLYADCCRNCAGINL